MNLNEIKQREEEVRSEDQPTYQTEQNMEVLNLMKETRELNQLMRSYITVHMDKNTISQQTALKEIQAIEDTSKKAQEEMILILKKQETTSEKQLEIMQETLTNYLNLMQEQEQKNKEKLENLNKEIISNTQKGIDLLNQKAGNTSDNLIKKMNEIFENLNGSVNKLKKNIEHTSFIDKTKTAFPIALTSSILTLSLYFIIQYFTK